MNNLYGTKFIEKTELEKVQQQIKNFEIMEDFSSCEKEIEAYQTKIHDLKLDLIVLEVEKQKSEQNV